MGRRKGWVWKRCHCASLDRDHEHLYLQLFTVEAFEKIQPVGPDSTTPLVMREAHQRKLGGIIQCQGETSWSFPESSYGKNSKRKIRESTQPPTPNAAG